MNIQKIPSSLIAIIMRTPVLRFSRLAQVSWRKREINSNIAFGLDTISKIEKVIIVRLKVSLRLNSNN